VPSPESITCLCGATELHLRAQPAARANCHCASCRDFYATAMLSATAWHADDVSLARGTLSHFAHPSKRLSRAFCAACGETLYGTNRLGMRVIPNAVMARAAGGSLPAALQPSMHLFYRERVIDIDDALPKYLDGWDGPLYEAEGAASR